MQEDIRRKNCLQKSHILDPGGHMYVFYINMDFSSAIKLEVRKFRNVIKFALQDTPRVASILFYFISIPIWVKNLVIKSYLKSYSDNIELFLEGQLGQD